MSVFLITKLLITHGNVCHRSINEWTRIHFWRAKKNQVRCQDLRLANGECKNIFPLSRENLLYQPFSPLVRFRSNFFGSSLKLNLHSAPTVREYGSQVANNMNILAGENKKPQRDAHQFCRLTALLCWLFSIDNNVTCLKAKRIFYTQNSQNIDLRYLTFPIQVTSLHKRNGLTILESNTSSYLI